MGFTSVWKEFNTFFVSFAIAQTTMINNLINLIFRIEHSVHKCGDIQTAAMISCVFDENNQNNNKLNGFTIYYLANGTLNLEAVRFNSKSL